jgi:nicotinamidase-related amidase
MTNTLPLPGFYNPATVTDLRFIDYAMLASKALEWRARHGLRASATDRTKVIVVAIDCQNAFCHPQGELFVAGRSGTGAIDDSRRLIEFIYRYLGLISELQCTLDTHRAYAIFHPTFIVDPAGNHPAPFTLVTSKDVTEGRWAASPFMASALGISLMAAQRHLQHYCEQLETRGRYALTIWPYHGMLGGAGHALVSGLEEACFFHAVARGAQTGFEVKGTNPLTENYSVLGPEVTTTIGGQVIAQRNTAFIEKLLRGDIVVIAGQAKSHCYAWTIDDLLGDIAKVDPALASKVYLLEDCTSPVVVPGLDYTDDANAAIERFRQAGMHVVRSTDPIDTWPGVSL